MNETDSSMKAASNRDESERTHEEANVTPCEVPANKRNSDDAKYEMTSLKRERAREYKTGEGSDSSFEDHHDGAPSTDTSATNHGAPAGDSDQMRLEERRAYNRRNAARSRQRVKDQLRDLQQQVIAHTTAKSELERHNVRLLAENNVLRDEVHKLRTILSGAPLFGQQQQSLQPFLNQPFPVGLGAPGQSASQQSTGTPFPTVMEPTSQATPQIMLPNTTAQQQNLPPFNFFSSSAQGQIQQEPSSYIPTITNQVGDRTDNQNAMLQLLLQQLMNTTSSSSNSNNISTTQLPSTNGPHEQMLQMHMNQQQQQQQQLPPPLPPDNSLGAFMSFLSQGANASAPSNTEAKILESLQPHTGGSGGSASNDGQQIAPGGYQLPPQQQQQQQQDVQFFLSQQQQQQQVNTNGTQQSSG